MRPVNLIPAEDRPGARRPMRSGPLAYIIVGALVALLAGVTLLVVTSNQISDRETELSQLQTQTAATQAKASRLAAYTEFHEVGAQRAETVANLANSRFDWERVMRQLSLVIPTDVQLTNLTGTVRPDVSIGSGESIALRESIPGPALQMVGCARGQDAVARFVTDLKDIDGVTRVGVQSSNLPTSSEGGESGSVSASGNCQTRSYVASFQIVVAFDAAPIPASATGAPTEVAPPAETTSEPASEESSSTTEAAPEGG